VTPTRKNIWNFRQNKPTYIVKDLWQYIDPDAVDCLPGNYDRPARLIYEVLLKRGVFKWLAVRRDLIKLKNVWKDRIAGSLVTTTHLKKNEDTPRTRYLLAYEKGYRRAIEQCRAEVRALCHSDRWRAPDFDREANKFLNELEKQAS
jgi:hypothetical protein